MATVEATSEQSIATYKEVQVPPFRTWDEFILDKSRYDWPSLNDIGKLNNRMHANLLYFQTNYFAAILGYVILYTFISAKTMAIGMGLLIIIGIFAACLLANDKRIIEIRQEHPYAVLGAILVVCYGFITFLPQVISTSLAWAVPILLCLVHSLFRLRSLRNKINQHMYEGMVRDSVMGRFFILCNVSLNRETSNLAADENKNDIVKEGIKTEKDIVNAIKKHL